MAKLSPDRKSDSDDEWHVRECMHTMLRAGEIVGDKKLMAKVKKMAAEHSKEMKAVSHQAGRLAKMGRISPKAMVRMHKR